MALGLPGNKGVISGMRTSSEIIIEVNLARAILDGKIPFHVSQNKVILSPGKESGYLPPKYFRTVLDFKKREFIY